MTYDPFRLSREPARSIYDAFQAQAAKRKTIPFEKWDEVENNVVLEAAKKGAAEHGLHEPTLKMVERAQRYAMGSTDYGSKWVYTLLNIMERTAKGEVF